MAFQYRLCCNHHPCIIDGETMYMCQHVVPSRPMDLWGNWAFDNGAVLEESAPVFTRKWGWIPGYRKEQNNER